MSRTRSGGRRQQRGKSRTNQYLALVLLVLVAVTALVAYRRIFQPLRQDLPANLVQGAVLGVFLLPLQEQDARQPSAAELGKEILVVHGKRRSF